jgi:ADP-ribose pyrophosphatase YjhB (NUDIX family)
MACGVHKLIADVMMLAGERVLLVRYREPAQYDHQRGWFLPNGLLAEFEHPDDAARRILREQFHIASARVQFGTIESFKGNDGSWHLTFHYKAQTDDPPHLRPAEMVGEAVWFPLDALPPRAEVAHHGWALEVIADLHAAFSKTLRRPGIAAERMGGEPPK